MSPTSAVASTPGVLPVCRPNAADTSLHDEITRVIRGIIVIEKVNLTEKFGLFNDYWSPKIIGELNDFHVKLAKIKDEFVWHRHDEEDELFLVIKGRLRMKLRDRDIVVEEGELIIIPRGVEHLPVAQEETHILLFEPKSTLNTGNIQDERTVADLDRI
jgi:mannose-6-phosphate isomerase-like protein (cupin superfamily)